MMQSSQNVRPSLVEATTAGPYHASRMAIIRIPSPDDPRIADYLAVREADLVQRRGLFLAEGAEVVRTIVRHGRFRTRSLFLSEKRVEAMQDVLQALPAEVPVYVTAQEV